jgi:DNA replication protein DnaC
MMSATAMNIKTIIKEETTDSNSVLKSSKNSNINSVELLSLKNDSHSNLNSIGKNYPEETFTNRNNGMLKNVRNTVRNTVRTCCILLSGSVGSGSVHLAVGTARQVMRGERDGEGRQGCAALSERAVLFDVMRCDVLYY